jgi:hypothetical protein
MSSDEVCISYPIFEEREILLALVRSGAQHSRDRFRGKRSSPPLVLPGDFHGRC